ncbi:LysR family transcriptional regulator [Aureimonas fodinaquatilis]|uniref:LysR family transcriptional regulator n=1 Tax=Aureimonas fodinaquatilis TaxID=2565783 RepID=A0A5B0DWT9_9HYPH|nr:LysR substrate-binding domain-containing protein [Aureimonas fodinaquatilis]KAA0970933.1 LysR family transcriptional regulator [Aureimonas fodinaquatilis]
MAKRLPPLNPLRAFEAAGRNHSLTRAAHELNVTHGAISHQIKALEATMQVQLLDRSSHRLRLTAHGAELLPAISAAFETIAAAAEKMKRPTSAGSLTISCAPALLSFWVIPRLSSFTAQYPDIRLRFNASNDIQNLRDKNNDIAILYGDGNWPDCWIRRWSDLELFPIVSSTRMNTNPIRSVRDLSGHVMLHTDDGREWQTWLAAADALDLPRGPQHHYSDARLGIDAAMHGHGVALGDTLTAASLLAKGQLIAPFNLSVPAADAFYVACSNDVRATPIVTVFIDWLFAQLDESGSRAEPQSLARRTLRRSQFSEPPPPRKSRPQGTRIRQG